MMSLFNCQAVVATAVATAVLIMGLASADAETVMPSADDTAALNAIIGRGGRADLVNNGKPYMITGTLVFSAGAMLAGQPRTTIRFSQATPVFTVPAGATNARIVNVTFDGTLERSAARPVSSCHAEGFSWTGGGMHYGGPLFLLPGCDGAVVSDAKFDFGSSGGIVIQGGQSDEVQHSEFDNNLGFGVFVSGGSTHFALLGNRGVSNAIEVIGVGYSAHDGEIGQNSITGSGDNCISVSGRRVVVSGNTVSYCLGSGIAIYGDENTVTHNTVRDNGQVDNPAAKAIQLWDGHVKSVYHAPGYSLNGSVGIAISGGFGGYGQNNTVENNTIIDDQKTPTQSGLKINTGTGPWKAGPVKVGTYVFANGSTYFALTGGVASIMPAGQGDVHDGQVTWRWCSHPVLATQEAGGNRFSGNVVKGFSSYATRDFTKEHGDGLGNSH